MMRQPKSVLFALSLVSLAAITGCGGSGNQPPTLEPIANMVVVAGRAIPAVRARAIDLDSTLLRFSTPEFPPETQKGLASLNIPARSLLEFVGLNLTPITGVLSGTPKTPGSHQITISVQDSENATDSKTFTVEVIAESLSLSFESPSTGNHLLRLNAGDTKRGGTVSYCIKTGSAAPKANDPCFKTDAAGGRTATIEIRPGEKIEPRFLYTQDALGNVLTPEAVPNVGVRPLVLVETNAGAFVLELEPEKTKVTTENFLQYVESGFFNDTVFHRIVSTFVVQGGGFLYSADATPKYSAKPGLNAPIVLEKPKNSGLSNTKGTIAMARTNDPDSATSQFFINVVDNSASLDTFENEDPSKARPGYAVFGKVIPPAGGLANDLPPAVLELTKTPVAGSLTGIGTIDLNSAEKSAPQGSPPFIISARRIN